MNVWVYGCMGYNSKHHTSIQIEGHESMDA